MIITAIVDQLTPQAQAAYNAVLKQVKDKDKFNYYFFAWTKYFAGRDNKAVDEEILFNSLRDAVKSYNGEYGAPGGWTKYEKLKKPSDIVKYGVGAAVGTAVGVIIGKNI